MKGQMEMIGVVFVIVFIVLGLLIYVTFASLSPDNLPTQQIRSAEVYGKALETAMLETTVPECQNTLGRVLVDCIESPYLACAGKPVCVAAHDAWNDMLVLTLGDENSEVAMNYAARVMINNQILLQDGENFVLEPFSDCTATSRSYAEPRQQIPTSAGTAEFVITLC